MNLISILWIAAGLLALVLAVDGLLTRFLRRISTATGPRLLAYSALMFALAIGCIILGVHEANA